MKKDLYDYSCLVWSPEGKLYQVEYAMEAVKQGTCLLGLRSDTHVVLCGLRNKQHELAFYQDKLFKISNSMGIGLCGLTADGRKQIKIKF
jgi:20S proteasome subunit alpha 6